MGYRAGLLLFLCATATLSAGQGAPAPIVTTACSPDQQASLDLAFERICGSLAAARGACRTALDARDARTSFERQCRRGLTIRCGEAACGRYFPKLPYFFSDDGTIEMGREAFAGGVACGGRDRPSLGPAHTLAHEMAHAARLFDDRDAEAVAYACRGEPTKP